MPARKLSVADSPEPITQYKAGLLCRDWDRLEKERLELGRKVSALKKQQELIERDLTQFVDANSPKRLRTVHLTKWRLSVVQVPKSFSAMTELARRIGVDAVEKLKSAVGTRDKLSIEML